MRFDKLTVNSRKDIFKSKLNYRIMLPLKRQAV